MSCMCLLVIRQTTGLSKTMVEQILRQEGFFFFSDDRINYVPGYIRRQLDKQTFVVSIADNSEYDNCEDFVYVPRKENGQSDFDAYEKRYAKFAEALEAIMQAGFSCKMYLTDYAGLNEDEYENVIWKTADLPAKIRSLNEKCLDGTVADMCITFVSNQVK